MLTGKVALQDGNASFNMEVLNHSKNTVATVEWPIIGDLSAPAVSDSLKRLGFGYGSGVETSLFPRFDNDHGGYGTNYPMELAAGRYSMVLAKSQGLYIGTHDTTSKEITRYLYELKPGYDNSFSSHVPPGMKISGHPVRISAGVEHYPSAAPGESFGLSL